MGEVPDEEPLWVALSALAEHSPADEVSDEEPLWAVLSALAECYGVFAYSPADIKNRNTAPLGGGSF